MSDVKLTSEQEAILRSQVFDATHPGSLLHDFALVLDYVGEKGVKAGGKYNLLPIDAIHVLDPKLARPMHLPLKRPQLRSHPYLQGLHLLLRATTLGRVEGQGNKARLVLDPTALQSWNELNPTERYFSLFEAWLLVADPEMVGMDGWGDCLLDRWQFTLGMADLPRIRERLAQMLFYRHDELYHAALADLFALTATHLTSGSAYDWHPAEFKLTPFGEALLMLLGVTIHNAKEAEKNAPHDSEEEDEETEDQESTDDMPQFGRLQHVFQPYFPAYQKVLSVGTSAPAREGVFVFKVTLGDVWRRIAMKHDHTLHDLLLEILRAFKFDFDHLYEFTYRDALGRTLRANHPMCREGTSADEIELGTLPLQPGQSMPLLYDFGDSWRFDVKLERIDEPGSVKKLPKLVESHGQAPEQYPDSEDD